MTLLAPRPVLILVAAAGILAASAMVAQAGGQNPPQPAAAGRIAMPIPAPPDVAAPPADAQKSKSGLAWKVLTPGTGTDHPRATDVAIVDYTGWNTKGVMFDSSFKGAKAIALPVNRVIKGFSEALQLMVAGEKRRVWIPEELAYKERPDRPQGMLVFDLELVSFAGDPTAAPADVAAPPADALKTKSGLAYKVLQAGSGARHPKSSSTVQVHYTGWTTDGTMFDSSVPKGQPSSLPLDGVIPGWTEGVQLMVEGEKTRFWIPQKIAYDGQAGSPKGMLVFDIELVSIQK